MNAYLSRLLGISFVLVNSLIASLAVGQTSPIQHIYHIENGDTVLQQSFVYSLCNAARTKEGEGKPNTPSLLEQLVIEAAGASFRTEDQGEKVYMWWSKFYKDCHCEADGTFPSGNLMHQVIHSGFREFGNEMGPERRLSIDMSLTYPPQNMNLLDYVVEELSKIEKKHNDELLKYQKDEEWKKIIFFFFLFSQFGIEN